MNYKKLSNGIQVVTFNNENAYSATIGVWVRAGAVDELTNEAGISHFIEHMMFKGTKTKNAKEIALSMDSIGGQINAFTSKECTCYNATVTYEHLDRAVTLLSDMLKNSLIDPTELGKERGVILEEISMVEDSPEDVVHRLHSKNFFNNSPVANSVIGSKETVSSFGSEDLKNYMKKHYTADRMVISIAGRFDDDKLMDLLEKEFGSINAENSLGMEYENKEILLKDDNIAFKNMKIEQTHICLGFNGISVKDEDLYSLYVFNNLFGGGMSSRLFQSIREEKAMCYTVYSYSGCYMNNGVYTIYSATNKNQVKDLVCLANEEIAKVLKEGPTKAEVDMAKEQMKGAFTLGIESTGGRMSSMGRTLLLAGKLQKPEDVFKRIEAVSYDSVRNVMSRVFDSGKRTATFVGDITREDCNNYFA